MKYDLNKNCIFILNNNMKTIYVYQHLNKKTNQIFYIGIGMKNRAWGFSSRNKYWKNYTTKYGKPIVEIIQLFDENNKDKAIQLEMELIKKYGRNGLDENGILVNRSLGGEHENGWKLDSPRVFSDEHKQKLKDSWNTRKYIPSEKRNKAISNANKGKQRDKISKLKKKPIIQYNLKNEFIKEWPSTIEAAETLKIKGIGNCLTNRSKTAGGYVWKYKI
jgi:hypothetical protein